jgi:malonyl-CoA O-methyltransferase
LNPIEIQAVFDRNAGRYERHAALEQEVGKRLLERIDHRRCEPRRILDLGCGTGDASRQLKQAFRKARVVGLDLSPRMLARQQGKSSLIRPLGAVCGDIGRLPFRDQAFDLVFSNMAAYWLPDPAVLFEEVRRVLQPEGLLLFSTLGPGSLSRLQRIADDAGTEACLPSFPDILVLGDALFAAGFREPVMDVDNIALEYPSLAAMTEELEATGLAMLLDDWNLLKSAAKRPDHAKAPAGSARYPLDFEIVYGTAFGPPESQPRKTDQGDIATISVDSLLKSRRMGYD